MSERLLRLEEAAERLGFAPRTLRRYLTQGKLRGRKATPSGAPVQPGTMGRYEWRIPESALEEFTNNTLPANREPLEHGA
jgi:predicted site-specific integrase-resolvase